MINTEKSDGVAIVTLRRAEEVGVHPPAIRRALMETIRDLDADDSVAVILLTGESPGFTAGLDASLLGAEPDEPDDDVDAAGAIRGCSKPIIAAVTGAAIAGAMEIVLACDEVVASTNARFADTHAKIGFTANPLFADRLRGLIGEVRAQQMANTGHFIEAEQAYEWGMFKHLAAPENLADTALTVARGKVSAASATA